MTKEIEARFIKQVFDGCGNFQLLTFPSNLLFSKEKVPRVGLGTTGVEIRVVVGSRQARRAAMFIVPRPKALKLRRSAMLTEHFAPTGLGRCGLAMAINIALLTEFSCVCSNRKFLNSKAVHPGPLPQPKGELFPTLELVHRLLNFSDAAIGGSLSWGRGPG